VLEIHLRGSDSPIMRSVGLESLLHDVRVVQGVPFLELATGDLVNLTEVERFIEHRELDDEQPVEERTAQHYQDLYEQGTPLPAVETCPHGYVKGTCTECKLLDEVAAQQPNWNAGGTGYPNPMLGRETP
jgi:hypothetical protein